MLPDVNYIALAAAVASGIVVSVVWYGFLFGALWQRLAGVSDKEMEELSQPGVLERISLHAVGLLVIAFTLSYFVARGEITTFFSGAAIGFFAWVIGVVVLLFGGILYRKAKRENVFVVVLDLAHWLFVSVVMGGVLALF